MFWADFVCLRVVSLTRESASPCLVLGHQQHIEIKFLFLNSSYISRMEEAVCERINVWACQLEGSAQLVSNTGGTNKCAKFGKYLRKVTLTKMISDWGIGDLSRQTA